MDIFVVGYWFTDYNPNGPSPNLFNGIAVFASREDAEKYVEKYARETAATFVSYSVHPVSVSAKVDVDEIAKAGAEGKKLGDESREDFLPCGADNRWWYKNI
jgi:hypothetical protein